jgi:hypothetical protein
MSKYLKSRFGLKKQGPTKYRLPIGAVLGVWVA